MYWNKQEQCVFDIVLFVVVILQLSTVLLFKADALNRHNGFVLAGVNVLSFAAMVPYAKWTWKVSSYRGALLRVVLHELILLGLIIGGTLLAMLVGRMRSAR